MHDLKRNSPSKIVHQNSTIKFAKSPNRQIAKSPNRQIVKSSNRQISIFPSVVRFLLVYRIPWHERRMQHSLI
jgi:hypothetical protein